MSMIAAAGSFASACPSCRLRFFALSRRSVTTLTAAANRASSHRDSRILRPTPRSVPIFRWFGTSRRALQNQETSSKLNGEPENTQTPERENRDGASVEKIVHEARQRFRDTLPANYLNEKEYDLYVRLYGPPLRETTPEDVGIPFAGVEPPAAPTRDDPDDPVLLRELEGGEWEEVPYKAVKAPSGINPDAEAVSSNATEETIEPDEGSISDDQRTYINAVARSQREYDALVKLQSDFEIASLRALEEAEELEEQEESEPEALENQEEEDLAPKSTDLQARSREEQARLSAAALSQLESASEEGYSGADAESDDVPAVRTHPYTREGRFATNPKTLPLPLASFTQPINQLLERTSIKHVRDAAEAALGGGGLPNSPATPASKKSSPQEPVTLQAGQHRMSDIEADAFISTVLPPSYASAMSALTEVRKRLGTDWLRNLINRKGGQAPRVLDAGAGGAGLAAWQDVLQAEWDVMRDNAQVRGVCPPSKQSVVVGSDKLRHRVSRFLHNTSFLPRLPDYLHSADTADQLLDAPQNPQPRKSFDVIIASYMLLPAKEGHRRKAVMNQLWSLLSPEGGVLILIEKAHPRGFEAIAEVRDKMIKEYLVTPPDPGHHEPTVTEELDPAFSRAKEPGFIVAPCTNHRTCPMYTTPGKSDGRKDFCHFQQRFVRPKFLQQILGAKHVNHDDVQFSYVAIRRGAHPEGLTLMGDEATDKAFAGYEDSPTPPNMLSLPRQILPPLKRKGHIQLELCTPSGTIERWTVPRSRGKQSYHDARKAAWGDLWPLGAKVRTPRNVRLGRSDAEDDGGVRSHRAKAQMKKKTKAINLEYDDSGITNVTEKNARPQRRTKGGKKPSGRSLREQMLGDQS